jgi:hypothetical protein
MDLETQWRLLHLRYICLPCRWADVVIAPASLHISVVLQGLRKDWAVCAQNCWTGQGAYTGEKRLKTVVPLYYALLFISLFCVCFFGCVCVCVCVCVCLCLLVFACVSVRFDVVGVVGGGARYFR